MRRTDKPTGGIGQVTKTPWAKPVPFPFQGNTRLLRLWSPWVFLHPMSSKGLEVEEAITPGFLASANITRVGAPTVIIFHVLAELAAEAKCLVWGVGWRYERWLEVFCVVWFVVVWV